MAEGAFYTLDSEFRLLDVSSNTLSLWGKSRGEILGRRLLGLFPQVTGGSVHMALVEATRTLRPARLRTESIVYGGQVEVEIYPISGTLQVRFAPVAQPA